MIESAAATPDAGAAAPSADAGAEDQNVAALEAAIGQALLGGAFQMSSMIAQEFAEQNAEFGE